MHRSLNRKGRTLANCERQFVTRRVEVKGER